MHSKFFAVIYIQLGVKAITVTDYYSQANAQAAHFNRTIVTKLQQCWVEQKKDWDTYALHFAYVFIAQAYRETKLPPFSLVVTWKPPGPATVCPRSALGTSSANSVLSRRLQLLHNEMLKRKPANMNLQQSQETTKLCTKSAYVSNLCYQ